MARGITGDFPKLAKWIGRLNATSPLLRTVAKNMSEEALSLVADGFRREADPYSDAWAKLKVRQGKILQDTGRLKKWHRVELSPIGFRIAPTVDYAKYHQRGTSRMVARKMVPSGGVLPERWRRQMLEAANDVFAAHFAGKR